MCIILQYLSTYQFLKCTNMTKLVTQVKLLICKWEHVGWCGNSLQLNGCLEEAKSTAASARFFQHVQLRTQSSHSSVDRPFWAGMHCWSDSTLAEWDWIVMCNLWLLKSWFQWNSLPKCKYFIITIFNYFIYLSRTAKIPAGETPVGAGGSRIKKTGYTSCKVAKF